MPESPVKEFQENMRSRLAAVFFGVPVEKEWAAIVGEDGLYSPRLDIAVGPFATGDLVHSDEFDRLVREYRPFLRRLFDFHFSNISRNAVPGLVNEFDQVTFRNFNARCFLAIEIENEVSRKHLVGGAINAAALGRIGIAVGWTANKVNALIRLRSYLLFLAIVGKNTFDPINLLVLSKEQLENALDSFEALPNRPQPQDGGPRPAGP